PLHRKLYGKHDGSQAKISQPASHPPKVPLSDSTNSLSSEKRKKSVSFGADEDVILLDNNDLQYYVPDSLSPSPQPRLFRFRSQKLLFDKENVDPGLSQQAPIHIQSLDISPHSLSQTNCSASKANTASSSKSQSHIGRSLVNSQHKVCPDVQILAENTLGDNVRAMTQKSDALYNSKLRRSRCSNSLSDADLPLEPSGSRHISDYNTHSQPLISNDSSVSQIPIHGSRRLTKTHSVQHLESFSRTSNFHITKSEVDNYEVICKLASSQFQCEDAVNLSGVRCTYWALGDSMKPGGKVKTFVVSAFCYSLFHKPNGHPDVSKRHYFFPNVADNLVKDINDADQDILARAFKRSSRALPLHRSEMLFFPTCYEDHWFVFVVAIKYRKYIMLDSLYSENHEFQEVVRERMRNSFEYHWSKYVHLDMGFPHYTFIYPTVPKQPSDNNTDSGIYAMVFIENWISTRTCLTSLFTAEDIPNIRIKITNNLFLHPKNSGMKQCVFEYTDEDQ
ncbi:unnamed protein product, partial [Urochloa humidicola]